MIPRVNYTSIIAARLAFCNRFSVFIKEKYRSKQYDGKLLTDSAENNVRQHSRDVAAGRHYFAILEHISLSVIASFCCYHSSYLYISPPSDEWGWCRASCLIRKAALDNCSVSSYHHGNKVCSQKKPRLRLARWGPGFDQYADQYQQISGRTQWTRWLL